MVVVAAAAAWKWLICHLRRDCIGGGLKTKFKANDRIMPLVVIVACSRFFGAGMGVGATGVFPLTMSTSSSNTNIDSTVYVIVADLMGHPYYLWRCALHHLRYLVMIHEADNLHLFGAATPIRYTTFYWNQQTTGNSSLWKHVEFIFGFAVHLSSIAFGFCFAFCAYACVYHGFCSHQACINPHSHTHNHSSRKFSHYTHTQHKRRNKSNLWFWKWTGDVRFRIRTYVTISTEIDSPTRLNIRLPIKQIKCIAFVIRFESK